MAVDAKKVAEIRAKVMDIIEGLRDPRFRSVRKAIPRGPWGGGGMPAAAVQYDWSHEQLRGLGRGSGIHTTGLQDYRHSFFIILDFDESEEDKAQDQLLVAGVNLMAAFASNPDLGGLIGQYEVDDAGPPFSLNPDKGKPILRKQIRYIAEMEAT